ncbi:MAG: hypothetical protein ACOZQL_32515 [Myxococcota bacterium]
MASVLVLSLVLSAGSPALRVPSTGSLADAPRRVTLAPVDAPGGGTKAVVKNEAPFPVATVTIGGAGVVFLGIGVGLLISGFSLRAQLFEGTPSSGATISMLTGAQAQALNDSASVQLGVGGAFGAIALALGGTALALW